MSSFRYLSVRIACILAVVLSSAAIADGQTKEKFFQRVATIPVFLNTDVEEETVAEIVAASKDGNTLIYTDGEFGGVGFVDIKNPDKPQAIGFLDLDGEPTSVAVRGKFALVASNTSEDFVTTSGKLFVIDIDSQSIVKTFELDGQPDSIAVSPDKRYGAVVIENERDEDLGDGRPPQLPAGFLVSLKMPNSNPHNWSLKNISLTGIADKFPEDPEPEYVDINRYNVAAITLQENNYIIYVHLPTGKIVKDFSAGTVDLKNIDTEEEDPALITLNSSIKGVPREPDAITWIFDYLTATADEGDLGDDPNGIPDGGSRGFTIFGHKGKVLFTSGNTLEHLAVRYGHYPDGRSGNKGNEPEAVEFARYGKESLLFVGSERSSVVFVYKFGYRGLTLKQTLPTGVGPEGLLAIPKRNLFVVASEVDDRGDKIRSAISIYKLANKSVYPTIASVNRKDGTPIPWSALSGLAADKYDSDTLYSIYDSFYAKSRIFAIDTSKKPASLNREIVLKDTYGKLKKVAPQQVNDDGTVNLDPEGIATRKYGGFWITSEGAGTFDDEGRPITSNNLIVGADKYGNIVKVITLPERLNAKQFRFGLEGITSNYEYYREVLYVVFQRAWQGAGDPADKARIGRYDTRTGKWTFAYYPLTEPKSPNGGWVGLSEVSSLGWKNFAVVERDNQGGPDAAIKLIQKFSTRYVKFKPDSATPNFDVVKPKLVRDLIEAGDLTAPGGLIYEKIEGMAVLKDGSTYIVNDNDGVDDNSGETQLIKLNRLFKY